MLFGRSETGAPRVLTLLRRLGQLIAVAGVLLLPAHEPLLAQAAVSEGPGPGIAEVTTRYSDVISIARAAGAPTSLRIELKQWQLAARGAAIEMPEQGFYVAHLMSGSVNVKLGGTSAPHAGGDFWVVEKGTRMVVTINKPGEQALIQTFSINPGH
jgi:hypothetical protein